MRITNKKYFNDYLDVISKNIPTLIDKFDFSKKAGDFSYLTKTSAIFSSNIEGNTVDLNTFMNYELTKKKFRPTKEIEEIEYLVKAYEFAQSNSLSELNLLKCHQILSKTILIKSKRGHYRGEPVGVFGKSGLVYLAVEPEFVKKEMKSFFVDINSIISNQLTIAEVFYFASLIHLRFVHIHPFMDGNGRAARILEKWFIAEKLGNEFWEIPSEEFYKNNQAEYYSAIDLGVNFYEIDYDKSLAFLKLLPNSLIQRKK